MKKEIYLHIPQPCHENWNAMTPVQQGRHCQSCCKTVVDFSNMSDKQILDTLSKAAGKTCGRFTSEQLERPVAREMTPLPKAYKIFLSAFIPAFLASSAGFGQQKLKGRVVAQERPANTRMLQGDTIYSTNMVKGEMSVAQKRRTTISGKVTGEGGLPVAGASIVIKGTNSGTSADANGDFMLVSLPHQEKTTIRVSCVGYYAKEVELDYIHPAIINLTVNKQQLLGEIVVVSGMVGGRYDDYEEEVIEAPIPNREIRGLVINEAGEAVPFASIAINHKQIVVADSTGTFYFETNRSKRKVGVSVSSTGYTSVDSSFHLPKDLQALIVITLKSDVVLDDVVVTTSLSTRCTRITMGAMITVSSVSLIDTVKTITQKFFRNEMFKVYPNPVQPGSSLSIVFRKPGEYMVQVFDEGGRLYVSKDMIVEASKQQVSILMPATLTPGSYYVKAVDTKSQKQFVDKIVVN